MPDKSSEPDALLQELHEAVTALAAELSMGDEPAAFAAVLEGPHRDG